MKGACSAHGAECPNGGQKIDASPVKKEGSVKAIVNRSGWIGKKTVN
jgi:hypothetical protein